MGALSGACLMVAVHLGLTIGVLVGGRWELLPLAFLSTLSTGLYASLAVRPAVAVLAVADVRGARALVRMAFALRSRWRVRWRPRLARLFRQCGAAVRAVVESTFLNCVERWWLRRWSPR